MKPLIIILWFSIVVIRSNFISRREKDFIGPDPRLEQILKQRMMVPAAFKAELRSHENDKHTYKSTTRPDLEVIGDTRRQADQGWLGLWFDEYNAENLKPKILQFQQYLIQLSKGFVEDIDNAPLIKKIAMDERYRVANIFAKLDEWVIKMRALYDNMKMFTYGRYYATAPVHRRVKIHWLNYQTVLRTHIDITYTIEFLLHIHKTYMDNVKRKNKTAGADSDSDEEDENQEKKALNMYDRVKGKNLNPEQERYMIQMMEAGLNPTMPP